MTADLNHSVSDIKPTIHARQTPASISELFDRQNGKAQNAEPPDLRRRLTKPFNHQS